MDSYNCYNHDGNDVNSHRESHESKVADKDNDENSHTHDQNKNDHTPKEGLHGRGPRSLRSHPGRAWDPGARSSPRSGRRTGRSAASPPGVPAVLDLTAVCVLGSRTFTLYACRRRLRRSKQRAACNRNWYCARTDALVYEKICSFCSPELRCLQSRKFGHARTAMCKTAQVHNVLPVSS